MIRSLEDLNEEQYTVATTLDGPMLILAGAGTGKTKTLVHRVAYMVEQGVAPEKILLLTFTNKAAREMKGRAATLLEESGLGCGIEASTFHSFCAKMLRIYGKEEGLDPDFSIITPEDEADAIDIIKVELSLQTVKGLPRSGQIVNIFSTCINRDMSLPQVIPWKYKSFQKEIEKIRWKLDEYKKKNGYLDYDDILVRFKLLLEKNSSVRRRIEDRYDYIMVDEYQDTNPLQDKILMLMRRRNDNLAVVGDDLQSIYGFRGAEVQNIIRFPDRLPGCKTVTLTQNYRSCQEILDLANFVTGKATEGYPKELTGQWESGEKPHVANVPSQDAEASKIMEIIGKLHEGGIPYHEICVLARASASFYHIEIALNKYGVAYEKHGGVKFLDRPHMKDAIAFLRLLSDPKDELSWFRVLKLHPGVGPVYARSIASECAAYGFDGILSDASAHKARKYCKYTLGLHTFLTNTSGKEFADALPEIIRYYTGIRETAAKEMRTSDEESRLKMFESIEDAEKDLLVLKDVAEEYDTLNQFLDDIILDNSDAKPQQEGDPLILSTIHSVKGLEYNSVIIMDCVDGIFPKDCEEGGKEDNEELRCFYVAVTRAKEHLYLMVPMFARVYGKTVEGSVSRYVRDAEGLYEETGERRRYYGYY